jgi:catechol 2,3-dioxygenase-like lactoylglutathione lyase family enzyme
MYLDEAMKNYFVTPFCIFASCFLFTVPAIAAIKDSPGASLRVLALRVNVSDMNKALGFYTGKLGFEVADRSQYPRRVVLKTDDNFQLILNKVARLRKVGNKDTEVSFTLQVNDLDMAIVKMKSKGVPFAETAPRKEGVGNAISILDPFGRQISMMHQTVVKVEPFKEPRIYNFGVLVPDMIAARKFYHDVLGFVIRSENYLPLDLPLGYSDNTFAFMLHYRTGVHAIASQYPKVSPYTMIVFESSDLPAMIKTLKQHGVKILSSNNDIAVFEDPFGNVSEVRQGALHGKSLSLRSRHKH